LPRNRLARQQLTKWKVLRRPREPPPRPNQPETLETTLMVLTGQTDARRDPGEPSRGTRPSEVRDRGARRSRRPDEPVGRSRAAETKASRGRGTPGGESWPRRLPRGGRGVEEGGSSRRSRGGAEGPRRREGRDSGAMCGGQIAVERRPVSTMRTAALEAEARGRKARAGGGRGALAGDRRARVPRPPAAPGEREVEDDSRFSLPGKKQVARSPGNPCFQATGKTRSTSAD